MPGQFMEGVFKSNPAMQAAITPYIGRFQNFQFNSIVMQAGGNFNLTPRPYSVELILIVSRQNNGGIIQVWNNSVSTDVGIPLYPGGLYRVWLDNMSWDVANAMCLVLSQCISGAALANTLARNTLDTSVWQLSSSLGSGGSQIADVCLGFGPQQ